MSILTAAEFVFDAVYRDIPYPELLGILAEAKNIEKQQQGYSEEEVEEMFDTLKRNSVNNVATISNVDLFISSWRKQFKNK